jgi:23S rRNA G2445 N2-methylase RlmL
MRPQGSLIVSARTRQSKLDHSLFLEQRVKDAVVDRFRSAGNTRPSVERDTPDLSIHVQLFRDRATLSLDTSGEPLHKRGWRLHQGRAPLAETLAAALILFSGWDRKAPLLDPFCGSGTIPIEAAWLAAGIRPGSKRSFGFEGWLGHDAPRYRSWRAELDRSPRSSRPPRIEGADTDRRRIEEARANAGHAGVQEQARFERGDARQLALRPGWNAWIVTNLPYGQRIGGQRGGGQPVGRTGAAERPTRGRRPVHPARSGGRRERRPDPEVEAPPSQELLELYRDFGARLRRDGRGSSVALLSGSSTLTQALGLEGMRQIPLENGGLPCELVLGRI